MGFLSNLFGGKKEDKALKEAFDHIHRLIDDEKFQLEMLNPVMMETILKAPAYDRDPKGPGPFGMSENNPIPVNGPLGELAYLSRIETAQGERLLFHRIGAVNTIDVFEAVTYSGKEWFIFFLDFYHPRRSRALPDGFHFTKDVPQFCGFHKFCSNFPYDFAEMKQSEQGSGLSMGYIALSKVTEQIRNQAYQRPLAHKAKLDIVKGRLTSSLSQKPAVRPQENLYVDQATANENWTLYRNANRVDANGAVLTVMLLTAAQDGWVHQDLISKSGEMLSVNIRKCRISDSEAKELSRILRAKILPSGRDNASSEMDLLYKLLEFFERGGFSVEQK
jgi:hypothetical protein